jgi:hypothetical protein
MGVRLLAALSAGTARMAALLAAQEPSALAAIADDIDSQAKRFRRDQNLAIPIASGSGAWPQSRRLTKKRVCKPQESALGHFRPIQPVSPYGSCQLRSESGRWLPRF